ncbi:MAG TPA: HIT domain-containing protein [Gaiellaceae bacterium]
MDDCPFCSVVAGSETDYNAQTDVIHRDQLTTAFVCPKWWLAAPAHVLVVPNSHYENVYAIPDDELAAVYATAKKIATAMRSAYYCEGTSMRQHNEPGGGQDVWHFHVHVFPRRRDDRLYERNAETRMTAASERAPYAERLRFALQNRKKVSPSAPVFRNDA